MRNGIFFVGLVLIIIGVSGLFIYFSNYQQLTSTLGQLGRAISPQLQQTYNQVLTYVVGSSIAALIGLALIIYGATSKPSISIQKDETIKQTTLTTLLPKKEPESPLRKPDSERQGSEIANRSILVLSIGLILHLIAFANFSTNTSIAISIFLVATMLQVYGIFMLFKL